MSRMFSPLPHPRELLLVMFSSRTELPYTRGLPVDGPSRRPGTFSLSADSHTWDTNVSPHVPEPDDALHNPTVRNGRIVESDNGTWISKRGFDNVGCLGILVDGLLTLFIVYPILNYMMVRNTSAGTVLPLGAKATGQVPEIPGNFGLIDLDTLEDAHTISH
ncbi:hypothetical protein IW261DRAFT_1414355 [Armillaria novae-zelandiae]|uniref:Uncharacterized protein n=1 Tax=Armillaria novae-zelandiae TaxID=153914 RepID=A0AA39UGX6_9AGAR|nr:hypothetical protein IW261DRAFT_1414355 [Armillaria novae-zelandiae]